jgi:hypothetical protein
LPKGYYKNWHIFGEAEATHSLIQPG